MKKWIGIFLSATLAVSVLAGCGSTASTSSSNDQSAQEEEVTADEEAEPAAEEAAEPAADAAADDAAAEEPAADAAAKDAAAEAADAAAEEPAADAAADDAAAEAADAAAEEPAADAAADDAAAAGNTIDEATAAISSTAAAAGNELAPLPSIHLAGMAPLPEYEKPDSLTGDEVAEMDKAMRAYTPPADSPLINNAENFYYYSQMNKDQQAVYDAMYMCASDPTSTNNIVTAAVSVNPESEEFYSVFYTAMFGMQYDHPELFWLYYASECNMGVYYQQEPLGDGSYLLYFQIPEPYEDFEDRMAEFNDAAEAFLADIDTSASDEQITRQIHDKLIESVRYNTPVSEVQSGPCDLAHTAYAALVKDSSGTPNYAVCDGYSQAFVYLLQQCGIEATVIVGMAGDKEDETLRGGHAWTVVKLDGDWYEIDSTWDDAGTIDDQVEVFKDDNPFAYGVYREPLDDPVYREKVQHYLYNLTTDEIEEYEGNDEYFNYVTTMGYVLNFAGPSVHYRANDSRVSYPGFDYLMELAPEATGTQYRLH